MQNNRSPVWTGKQANGQVLNMILLILHSVLQEDRRVGGRVESCGQQYEITGDQWARGNSTPAWC